MDLSSILNTAAADGSAPASRRQTLSPPGPEVAANRILHPVAPPYPPSPANQAPSFPPSPTYAAHNGDGRPDSSYSNHALPVEPSPPLDRGGPPLSSGLQHYHHGSKSPEQQRRESLTARPDFTTTLPPIKSLAQLPEHAVQHDQPARYGFDTSQMATSDESTNINHVAQNREPDYVRASPVVSQIREPDMTADASPVGPAAAQIKDEPADTPRDSPSQKVQADQVDPETAKAILAAANEHGTRGTRPKPAAERTTPEPVPTSKKRPAPAKATTKKGVVRKPPAKKRKVEDDEASADAVRRSMTPLGKPTPAGLKWPKSKSNTPQIASSPAPETGAAASPAASAASQAVDAGGPEEDYADSDVDDDEVYCICRKPDNHSWMIACDGGCDDWFHGKCVKIQESQGELIDKYICPNCERLGKGSTTWKPCCRRVGCNRPARVAGADGTGKAGKGKRPSKYCSEECGQLFMKEKTGVAKHDKEKNKKKRADNPTDPDANDDDDDDDDDDGALGPRGGALRPGEVKALADAAKDVETFRQLGDGVLSPPATASPEQTTFAVNGDKAATNGATPAETPSKPTAHPNPEPSSQPLAMPLTPQETTQLSKLSTDHENLVTRKALLRDREKFLHLVVEQVGKHADREGIKPKDVCGYDARLAWGEAEFARWRDSAAGRAAMASGSLDAGGADGDVAMPDASPAQEEDKAAAAADAAPAMCLKKRCEQHKQWQKVALNDIRAEQQDAHAGLARLELERRELKEQAGMRWRAEAAGASAVRGGGEGEGGRGLEGWVEVV